MTASMTDLAECYLKLRNQLQRSPSISEIVQFGKYSQEYFFGFFGSYSNFVMLIEREIDNAVRYTKKDLISEYRIIQAKLMRPPTLDDINKESNISPMVFLYHWGSWNNFLDTIGEDLQYRNTTDKELVKVYFYLRNKLLKDPNIESFKEVCKISNEAFDLRYGGGQILLI
jgi:hypothetical protein